MILLLCVALQVQDGLEKRIDAIVPRLGAEDRETRCSAAEELKKLALSDPAAARPLLRKLIEKHSDTAVKAGLQTAIDVLPILELKISVEGEARVGERLKWKVRIRNLSDIEQVVVRSLDGSDDKRRYPHYNGEILDDGGLSHGAVPHSRCNYTNPIKTEDLLTIEASGEVDPFGEGSFSCYPLEFWKPTKEGLYVVKLTVDFDSKGTGQWNGVGAYSGGELPALLAKVPRVKLEAVMEVEVKPARAKK